MTEKKKLLLRIDEPVWKALQAMAADDLRSINGQIEYLLKLAVRDRLKHTDPPNKENDSGNSPAE